MTPSSLELATPVDLRVKGRIFVLIGLLFVAALVVGAFGIFDTPARLPIPIGVFLLVPIVGFVAAYVRSPVLRRALRTIRRSVVFVWGPHSVGRPSGHEREAST